MSPEGWGRVGKGGEGWGRVGKGGEGGVVGNSAATALPCGLAGQY